MAFHTDIPSRRQVERLLQARGDHLVSIYLPTSPITPEADASRIAFKNQAAEAVAELRAGSASAADREAIEQALEDLHDDGDFWAEQAHSLAIFADPLGLRSTTLGNSLMLDPEGASSDEDTLERIRDQERPGRVQSIRDSEVKAVSRRCGEGAAAPTTSSSSVSTKAGTTSAPRR